MKSFRIVALLAALLAAAPVAAQQVQNHAVPIGKGAGVTGFGAAVPGVAGQPLVSQGAASDPSFGTISNSGFTSGAANTAKGSLDGTNVTDIPLPSCTAVNSAWRYTNGVGISCAPISVTTGFDTPINLGLSSSAAGGALTINVTQANGSAPSAAGPVLAAFRSTTAASGVVNWATISSALSLTVPSGASLGTTSGNVPFRIWVFLTYNAGTPAIAVATCSNPTAIFPCAAWEGTLKTSITISAGATSAGTLYTGTGVALDAVRIIGYCDFGSGLTTAGTYTSACTAMQTMGPGIKKPGDVVQTVAPNFGALSQVTSSVLVNTNITANITPTSTPNLVRYTASTTASNNTGTNGATLQMYRNASVALGALLKIQVANANFPQSVTLVGMDAPGAVTAQTYVVRMSIVNSGTAAVPASASDGATEILEEIQG